MSFTEYKTVKPYYQHGFNPVEEVDEWVYGNCPLCGRQDHFYIAKKNTAFKCHSCGKGGNLEKFFALLNEKCQTAFRGDIAIKLQKKRGLKIATLRKFGIGYNSINKILCLPVLKYNDNSIHDLRRYTGGRWQATKGRKLSLLNWGEIASCKDIIYLCEGEWDTLTMWEILWKLGDQKNIVVGSPGAGTFKGEWSLFFKDKNVIVIYDNDKAGQEGSLRVFNSLKPVVESLQFIRWPDDSEEGFDLNDLYKRNEKNAAITYKQINEMLDEVPPGIDLDKLEVKGDGKGTITIKEVKTLETFNGGGLNHKEVYKKYKQHLHLPDTSVIDILYGSIIANRLPGDPIWLFIVAPSGFTKSEFSISVSKAKNIHTEDTLTVASMVSGFTADGVDYSLLPQLDGKILNVKDFTTILKMNVKARDEIFGMLRSIYDGEFKKRFGNTQKSYTSKFGIVAGVTPAVEVHLSGETALGERFLRCWLNLPKNHEEHIQYIERAMSNVTREDIIRADLQRTANSCLNFDFINEIGKIEIDSIINKKLVYLSLFTSILRSAIERDQYTKQVQYKPFQEAGTRLVKQKTKLLMGISYFHRQQKVTNNIYKIVCKLAKGTIPSRRENILQALLYKGIDKALTIKQLSNMISLPPITTQFVVDSLRMLKVVEKSRYSHVNNEYHLTKEIIDIMEKAEVYK